ncbi:MAG: hypothetical protein ABIG89_02910 [Candidatus Woesearchaeota archaeon]
MFLPKFDNCQTEVFKKTVELAAENNIIDLSFISIDGSTFKANAGSKRYFDILLQRDQKEERYSLLFQRTIANERENTET